MSLIAQSINYADKDFIIKCTDRKFTFKAVLHEDNSDYDLVEAVKYLDPANISRLLSTTCQIADEKTFFLETQKTFHTYCLELQKQFYNDLEDISKDETVQMELTEALFADKQYEGITENLVISTKKMQAFCVVRDALSAKL